MQQYISRVAGWKYKPTISDEQKRQVLDDLFKLYKDLEHLTNWGPHGGKNTDKMGYDKGFDLVFTSQFKDAQSRDTFNISPEHLAFIESYQSWMDDVFVYDFVQGEFGY